MPTTDSRQKIIMGICTLGFFSTHEEICIRTSIFEFENRLCDWFGFGSSFYITDLQDNEENQGRNLQVLLEGIIFPWQGAELSMTEYGLIMRLNDTS